MKQSPSFGNTASRRGQASREQFADCITAAVHEFVNELDEDDVHRLCRNGSIWIKKEHARCGSVGKRSFEILGPTSESWVQSYGEGVGACCLFDFRGLAESFIFDDGTKGHQDEMDAEAQAMLYSVEKGREGLMFFVEASLERDIDRVWRLDLED